MSLRKVAYLMLIALVVGGCTAAPNTSMLNPSSFLAAKETGLFWILFWMGAAVFVFVVALLVIALVRGARMKNLPRQIQGNSRLEFIWTAIPILLVIIIFVLTLSTMNAVAAPPPSKTDINVNVIGHRWWWEFDYPDLGIKTANQLHIPVDTNVHIALSSVDVVHSFWAPNLNGKTDVIPGQSNTTWIRADQPGVYQGHCTEYCGEQHANMGFEVVAQTQADYDAWVAQMQKPAPPQPTDPQAQAGYKIVTQGICSSCHTVDGTNAKGLVGPNLTHLYSRTIFAGGVLPLNDQNLSLWLHNPNDVKPGNLMANVRLTDQQIQQVIAYLKTLK